MMKYAVSALASLLLSATLVAQPQGQSEPKDISDLRKGAEQGNAQKQSELGDRYYTGNGVAKDHAEAMQWYRKAAEQGDAKKQQNLGFLLWIEGDNVEAAKWYVKAAEQGNALSQSNLGSMYRDGKGVPQNYAEAAKWFRKAAENDAPGSRSSRATDMSQLGTLYEKGLGVPQDYAEAAKWYRRAVETGNDMAAFSFYFLCRDGKSTKRDCADVAKWLSILANQVDNGSLFPLGIQSQFYLGTLYEKGLGVPQDHAEAAKWYRKAADQGDSTAQFTLGGLYVIGRGVPQDFVVAHMWLNLAASLEKNGDMQKGFAEQRDDLAKMMTSAQIAEAQRLARDWKPTTTK
jgi:uncharacterized protein